MCKATPSVLALLRTFGLGGDRQRRTSMAATGAQLERICRGYRAALTADQVLPPAERAVRRRELPGGMFKLEIVLAPDEADLVLRALDRAREVEHEEARPEVSAERSKCERKHAEPPQPRWLSRADGVVALVKSYSAGSSRCENDTLLRGT